MHDDNEDLCGDLECLCCYADLHHYCDPSRELVCSTCGATWEECPVEMTVPYQYANERTQAKMRGMKAIAFRQISSGLASG